MASWSDTESIRIYLGEIKKIPLLSREDEIRIATLARDGDELAKKKLITHNLRYSFSISSEYFWINGSFSELDLINEGNIGMIKAIDKFDPMRGYKFITYANWWIRQHIMRYIANNKEVIRLPNYIKCSLDKLKKADIILTQRLSGSPSKNDLAEELGIESKKVEYLLSLGNWYRSIDIGNSLNTINVPSTAETYNPVEMNRRRDLEERLREIIFENSGLVEREKGIIKMRFGLVDGIPKTLDEVGTEYNLTRERIRQIEAKVLKKLRRVGGVKLLKEEYL